MRTLTLKTLVSLDGFLEGPEGAMDWFGRAAGDDEQDWKELFRLIRPVDTVLMGRGMYPGYAGHWRKVLAEPEEHPKNEVKYARWAEKTPHIVFSRTVKELDWPVATVNGGDLEKEVQKLKRGRGGDMIVYGGAAFASALAQRGLVDEYHIHVHPVVLGGGKALFGGVRRKLQLKLTRSKPLSSGAVLLHYENDT
jgi:dihydrofolate reductase